MKSSILGNPFFFMLISRTIAFLPKTVRHISAFSKSLLKSSEVSSGHQTKSPQEPLSPEVQEIVTKFREHQSTAARLSMAEEVRTLIEQSIGYGVISTNSDQFPGYPTGSVVGFALEDNGNPFFVFSTMSAHTRDVLKVFVLIRQTRCCRIRINFSTYYN